MPTVTIEEAQANLSKIIRGMQAGEEVVITEDGHPVARVIAAGLRDNPVPRKSGTLRGTVLYMAPDFDAPLEDFKDYME